MDARGLRRAAGVLLGVLLSSTAGAATSSAILGTVREAGTQVPLPGVVVTASSTSLPAELTVITTADGSYRISGLPPGTYALRFERELFLAYSRVELVVREDHSPRVNVELAPQQEDEVLVPGPCGPPMLDPGSTSTGAWIDSEVAARLPVSRPLEKDNAVRTTDSLAAWVSGVQAGPYGPTIHGATASENGYLLDGLSTTDAYSGRNALALSAELTVASQVKVVTDGLLPEYGQATGGILQVETPSGSNQLHGSVFSHWTPGLLEGRRAAMPDGGSPLATEHLGDFGATLGGPLIKDRLWFFAGATPSLSRVKSTQSTVSRRSLQALGKLTYFINLDHQLSLSILTAPDSFRTDMEDVLQDQGSGSSTRVVLRQSSAFMDKKLLVDVLGGWMAQRGATLEVDSGNEPGSSTTRGRERDYYQGSARATWFPRGLGRHVFRAGVDAEHFDGENTRGVLGGFVQDSWTLNSHVTVNGGVRYDVQRFDAPGPKSSRISTTVHGLSPRMGVAVDPSGNGRMRLFAHVAKYQGLVPLGLLLDAQPNPDPDLRPASSREFVAGAEYEFLAGSSVSASYLHRSLQTALGSPPGAPPEYPAPWPGYAAPWPGRPTFNPRPRDPGGVMLVNPGWGLGSDLPRAERTYDAVTLAVRRSLFDGWLGHVSYTWSQLRGNRSAPWPTPSDSAPDSTPDEPEGSVWASSRSSPSSPEGPVASGVLALHRPHTVKVYGAREFRPSRVLSLTPGLAYFGSSAPLVEGEDSRAHWVHTLDVHLDAAWLTGRDTLVSFNLDVFNVFNIQAKTHVEEALSPDGSGSPRPRLWYQAPRQVRLGVRYSF